MKLKLAIACLAIVGATHANAESHAAEEGAMAEVVATGDATKGEKVFKRCVACHVVVDEAGETLAGKRAKAGPNLYGIAGGAFGEAEDFKYGKGALAAAGTVMDEATFVAYVADPTAWLRDITGDSGARSKMTFKLKKEEDGKDVFAYLLSLQ